MKLAYIVTTGESLNHIDKSYFPEDGLIIAMNEASWIIQSLGLPNTLYGYHANNHAELGRFATGDMIICSKGTKSPTYTFYKKSKRIIMDLKGAGIEDGDYSIVYLLCYLKLNGFDFIKLISFDAYTHYHVDRAHVAKQYDPSQFGCVSRFAGQVDIVKEELKNINHEFITPTPLLEKARQTKLTAKILEEK